MAYADYPFDITGAHLEILKNLPFVAPFRCDCSAMRSLRYVGDAIESISGYSPQSLVGPNGHGLDALVFAKDQERVRAELLDAINIGGAYQIEYRLVSTDGRTLWVEEIGRVQREAGVEWIVGLIQDVDSRKRAQIATEQNEARFRELALLSVDWFWEQDSDLRFTWFSSNAATKTFTEIQSVIGKRRWELPYHHVTDEQMAAHRAQLEAHLPFRNFEWAHITVSGQVVWYDVSGNPIFDDESRFLGYRGIGRNIDARKQAELALSENQTKLAQIIDGCPVPIFVIDAQHRVTHWNRACEHTTGALADAILGTTQQWRVAYPEARPVLADLVLMDRDTASLELERLYDVQPSPIANAIETEAFYPGMGVDGRWLYMTAAPLRDQDGRALGAIETLQDFTERRRAEERVRQLNDTLNKRNVELASALEDLKKVQADLIASAKLASLGSLVAGVAHELNTPVGNALTVTTALSEKLEAFERSLAKPIQRSALDRFLSEMREGANIAERNLHRTADLIRSFKQVAIDQTSERRRTFYLCEVVREITLILRPMLSAVNCSIIDEVPSNICMESYPGALGQVLTNLFNNACVHAFEGRDGGSITVTAKIQDDDLVQIVVSDDGVGIPTSHIERVFDPFFTTKLGQGGSGLGLNIAHNIVTGVLKGRIEVRSVIGVGTDFELNVARCVQPVEPKRFLVKITGDNDTQP